MIDIIQRVNHKRGIQMGHSQADKADSHERIVRIAAARLREAGLDGVGVAELMKAAGLTHGGFYRHFSSRDELVAEAVESALAHGEKRMTKAAGRDPQAPFCALVDSYLSPVHRDNVAESCAIVTLAGDMARRNDRARAAYTRQVAAYLERIAHLLEPAAGPDARRRAIAAFSTLVGAVALARAVDDDALSLEILQAAGATLKAGATGTGSDPAKA